jgi:hypothetical protein
VLALLATICLAFHELLRDFVAIVAGSGPP